MSQNEARGSKKLIRLPPPLHLVHKTISFKPYIFKTKKAFDLSKTSHIQEEWGSDLIRV
jgi:hypothetical protein